VTAAEETPALVADELEARSTGRDHVTPIPQEDWDSLPASCLIRMFEFRSIREEYEQSFERAPGAKQRDPSQRLALEDIVELALINSREYQTQKETLYRVALRLTLARFDYDLKFATVGNGTDVGYSHNRNSGVTVDNLGIPTRITGDKLLATGGSLLARFANDVVLTFNGPQGFAADIGSELLLDISQSVFQRDVVFERLTQAERDVVYAARDFLRFRKELFRDLASDYYRLILSYRQIEIATQNYFTNLREFLQGQAEYRFQMSAKPRSPIEVDQLEQVALTSRSVLIRGCNSLEGSLDNLKIRIGLPPELPINLDLTELEELTLRDEATTLGELVRRSRRGLLSVRRQPAPERAVLLNGAIGLTDRMLRLFELRERLGQQTTALAPLEILLARLSVDEARQEVRFDRRILIQQNSAVPAAPPVRIFGATMELVETLSGMIARQLNLAARISADPEAIAEVLSNLKQLDDDVEDVRSRLAQAVAARELGRIPELIRSAESLLSVADGLAREADALTQAVQLTPEQESEETLRQVDELLAESTKALAGQALALAPIEIDMDDAMLTALVLRFDVMNQRGALADTWRRIKLAGDDLRSVLNLNAAQTIRTRSGLNRPFDFTFDDSQTRLSFALDTPFNRMAQRNAFRQSLIDYQAGLRSLMRLEDTVKLSIRDDLRQLQLRREQYRIAVASAALAYQRVVTTKLQRDLGVQGVLARDFIEAQRAYTTSLVAVAGEHILYILDRVELFLDLELLQVDESGFWPELYNEGFQAAPHFQLPPYARPAYGELPCGPCYSRKVKRMLDVPTGSSVICKEQQNQPQGQAPSPEEIPAPAPEGPSPRPDEMSLTE
jgi:hypothetical protein